MKVTLVAQGTNAGTLEESLNHAAAANHFDRLDVAVAYATKQGILTLEKAIGGFPPKSRWVVGLDDAITQPEALDYLLALQGAKLRVAALSPQRRFHPKLYSFARSDDPSVRVTAVGSGNMTLRGLRHNGEAAVLLAAESAAEAKVLKEQWETLWCLGEEPTTARLETYASAHAKAKKERKKIVDLGVSPPEPAPNAEVPEVLNGNPTTATYGWLDVGSATAQGREVELPRAMVPYFGVGAATASPVYLKLKMANGQVHTLALTMREDNSMWRIGFTQAAINAGTGRSSLRPTTGGNRSDLAVRFARTGKKQFDVSFATLGSPEYATLVSTSTSAKAHYRTRKTAAGRSFGFY